MVDSILHESTSIPGNPESSKSFEISIALKKSIQSCTLHPISRFVSYSILSLRFHTFTANLDKLAISRNIYNILKILEWREAIMEEIKALEKNRT